VARAGARAGPGGGRAPAGYPSIAAATGGPAGPWARALSEA
jgi:hypothetical protein